MRIDVLSLTSPRKPSILATAKVRITFSEDQILKVDDIRVLKNNRGELWIAMPTHSVQDGKNYRYERTVDMSKGLHRHIEQNVLDAYEQWSADQSKTVSGGSR